MFNILNEVIIQFILSVGILLRYKGARMASTQKEIEPVGVVARESRVSPFKALGLMDFFKELPYYWGCFSGCREIVILAFQ